jgi:hypothetical protein
VVACITSVCPTGAVSILFMVWVLGRHAVLVLLGERSLHDAYDLVLN